MIWKVKKTCISPHREIRRVCIICCDPFRCSFYHQNGHLILVSFWMDASFKLNSPSFGEWRDDFGNFKKPILDMVIFVASVFVAWCRMMMMMMMVKMRYVAWKNTWCFGHFPAGQLSPFIENSPGNQIRATPRFDTHTLFFKHKKSSLLSTRCSGTILLMNKFLH